MPVLLVHGFLGLPEDWTSVSRQLLKTKPHLKIKTPHLWNEISPLDHLSLEAAAEKLSSQLSGEEWTVVGYSLGGRIISHWPKNRLKQIQKMILISTHGGLEHNQEKKERIQADQVWADRFLTEDWENIQTDWNTQAVFSRDSVRPSRRVEDFERQKLAGALRNWSLGRQELSFDGLRNVDFPIHYVSGKRDAKFSLYAQALQSKFPNWNYHFLSAGHSLHLSHPEELAQVILG